MPTGSLTDYAESRIIKWLLGQATQASVLTNYIGLLTAVPGDGGGVTGELNGTYLSGATRPAIAFDPVASGATYIVNSADLTLGSCIADAPAPVVAIAGYDSATFGAGNMLWYCPVAPQILKNGDPNVIPKGAIVVRAGGNWTIAGAKWMLELLCGRTTLASAMTPYMGLFNRTPTDNTGSDGVEVSATGYSRKPISGLFSTPTAGQAVNTSPINFTSTPWTTDAGDVTGCGIWTALAGTLYMYATTASKRYVAGDPVVYPVGSVVLQGD
jgi:3D (Asp-Asp-Asp) domain-containing protein